MRAPFNDNPDLSSAVSGESSDLQWMNIGLYQTNNFYMGAHLDPSRVKHFKGVACEAILISKGGGFSFDRFCSAYLDAPFPMSISGLAYDFQDEIKGPHNGAYDESAITFLAHDFGHSGEFLGRLLSKADESKNGATVWHEVRSIFYPIYKGSESKKMRSALFHLLHEGNELSLLVEWLKKSASPLEAFDKAMGDIIMREIKYGLLLGFNAFSLGEILNVTYNELEDSCEVLCTPGVFDDEAEKYHAEVAHALVEIKELHEQDGAFAGANFTIKKIDWKKEVGADAKKTLQSTIKQSTLDRSMDDSYRTYFQDEQFFLEGLGIIQVPNNASAIEKLRLVFDGMNSLWLGFKEEGLRLLREKPDL